MQIEIPKSVAAFLDGDVSLGNIYIGKLHVVSKVVKAFDAPLGDAASGTGSKQSIQDLAALALPGLVLGQVISRVSSHAVSI